MLYIAWEAFPFVVPRTLFERPAEILELSRYVLNEDSHALCAKVGYSSLARIEDGVLQVTVGDSAHKHCAW